MLNISHSVYPPQEESYNQLMESIYLRDKVKETVQKDLSINRPLGFFKVEVGLFSGKTKIINYLKK
jgi:hypothetical protein